MTPRDRAGRPIRNSALRKEIDMTAIWEFLARQMAERNLAPEFQREAQSAPMSEISKIIQGGTYDQPQVSGDDQAIINWLQQRNESIF